MKGKIAGEGGGADTGDGNGELQGALVVIAAAGFVIGLVGDVVGDDGEVGGIEAGVHGGGVAEAAEEEAGSDQGHEGEGDLRHDEEGAGIVGAVKTGGGGGAFFEVAGEIGAGGAEGGGESEEEAGTGRDGEGEEEDGGIEIEAESGAIENGWADGPEEVAAPAGEEESGGAAGQGEEEAFGEELAEEAGAGGAEGEAEGDFLVAGGGPGEEEIGDVGAGDQENEGGDDHEQDAGAREDRAGTGGKGGVGDGGEDEAAAEVFAGVLALEFPSEDLQGALGLGEGDAGFEASDGGKEEGAALGDEAGGGNRLGVDGEGEIDIGSVELGESLEGGRSDAEDQVGAAVEFDGAAGDGGVAVEEALPEPMAEDGDGGAGGDVFFGAEGAAEDGVDTEGEEVVGGDEMGHEELGVAASGEVDGDGNVQEERREDGVVVAVVLEVGVGDGEAAGVAGVGGEEGGEVSGVADGERAEEKGVEKRKDGGVGADAESQ